MHNVTPGAVWNSFWARTSLNVYLNKDGVAFFSYAYSDCLQKMIGFPAVFSSQDAFEDLLARYMVPLRTNYVHFVDDENPPVKVKDDPTINKEFKKSNLCAAPVFGNCFADDWPAFFSRDIIVPAQNGADNLKFSFSHCDQRKRQFHVNNSFEYTDALGRVWWGAANQQIYPP